MLVFCRPGHTPHEGEQASVAACGPSTSLMPPELQRKRSEGGQVCFAATQGRRGSNQVGKYLDVKFTPHLSGAQLNILWERAITYYQCAASQGHPRAALELFYYYVDKDPSRALGALQQAAKFGEPQAFNMLSNLFSQRNKQWNSYFPNLDEDQERAKRYQKIASMLTSSGLELESTESKQIDLWDIPYQVTDLDDIVPLPDVTLPVWDGKTAFLRWLNSPSPAKPSDELMKRLAAKANLDWQTGL